MVKRIRKNTDGLHIVENNYNSEQFFFKTKLKYHTFATVLTNKVVMKKFLTLLLMGLTVVLIVASCKSSSGGHCDAYGSIDQVSKSDVTSK
jgi:hypothetical protein